MTNAVQGGDDLLTEAASRVDLPAQNNGASQHNRAGQHNGASPQHGAATQNTGPAPSNGRRLLVVEDEPTIANAIVARLRNEGYQVTMAADGPSAVRMADETRPDLVLLDVMLPGFDGLEVCRRIQAQRPVPVMMLTARDDETDILIGLGVGADDYLTKPFSMRELIARIHALLRRLDRARESVNSGDDATAIRAGRLEIDPAERRVRLAGDHVHLTPTEFDLLVALARRPRAVLTRDQLLAEVWGWSDASGTRTVDSHIKTLRRKIGARWVRTVHGVGYSFEPQGD